MGFSGLLPSGPLFPFFFYLGVVVPNASWVPTSQEFHRQPPDVQGL